MEMYNASKTWWKEIQILENGQKNYALQIDFSFIYGYAGFPNNKAQIQQNVAEELYLHNIY